MLTYVRVYTHIGTYAGASCVDIYIDYIDILMFGRVWLNKIQHPRIDHFRVKGLLMALLYGAPTALWQSRQHP